MTIFSLTLNEEPGDLASAVVGRCEDLGGASYVGALRNTESVLAIREFKSMSTRPSSARKSISFQLATKPTANEESRTSDLVREIGFQLCQLWVVQIGSREWVAVLKVVWWWGRFWPLSHVGNCCVLQVVCLVHSRRRLG